MGGPGSGPVPKSQRMSHAALAVSSSHASKGTPVEWPGPQLVWPDSVKDVYLSLRESGQSNFFEQSDVAMAYLACEILTRGFDRHSAVMIQTGCNILDDLASTVGARKRMRIELDNGKPEAPPSAKAIERYKVIAGTEATS
jgi:hypothetical protein